MADSRVKTANICNITIGTRLNPNVGGSGTYIADNSISVHMASGNPASGIYATALSEASVIGDKYTISFIPICATNTTLLIELAGVQKSITFTSGERKSVTVQASATNRNVAFYSGNSVEKTIIIKDIQIEKGDTATPYRPYSATGWVHSLRKLTTATEAVENPLYSDGTAITAYTIKGNTVQNGTPTPSNPVDVNGVGKRTVNLLNPDSKTTNEGGAERYGDKFPSGTYYIINNTANNINWRDGVSSTQTHAISAGNSEIVTTSSDLVVWHFNREENIMVADSSIALPFEPYGYKIPISNGGVTTNIYLGSTQTVRKVKKYVYTGTEDSVTLRMPLAGFFTLTIEPRIQDNMGYAVSTHYQTAQVINANMPDLSIKETTTTATETGAGVIIKDTRYTTLDDFKTFLQQQYVSGTPVTVWYCLTTEETGAINEPLMKLVGGDSTVYADTLSNATAIPTTEGANSITVDTTVQPSEFTATWTGWHDSSVKEYDGSQWNE